VERQTRDWNNTDVDFDEEISIAVWNEALMAVMLGDYDQISMSFCKQLIAFTKSIFFESPCHVSFLASQMLTFLLVKSQGCRTPSPSSVAPNDDITGV
jgi:hypothetical protein